MSKYAEAVYSVMRIVVAFLYACHGAQKLFGIFNGPPTLTRLLLAAGIIEFGAGVLIFIGLFTRPAAFIASGEMAFAYFMMHAPRGILPIVNGGDPAVLNCFVFLFISAYGAGAFSVEAMMARRK